MISLAYPSGKMLMICFPMIRDEFCKILAGLTRFSEIESSRSYMVLTRPARTASKGIYSHKSVHEAISNSLTYRNPEHEHAIENGMQ